jgi:hypothetical protein
MFIIAQAIATTRIKITSQNLIGIRASLRRVTSTALGLPVSARHQPGGNEPHSADDHNDYAGSGEDD